MKPKSYRKKALSILGSFWITLRQTVATTFFKEILPIIPPKRDLEASIIVLSLIVILDESSPSRDFLLRN